MSGALTEPGCAGLKTRIQLPPKSAKKYLLRTTAPTPGESTLWVGDNGYPLRIEVVGDAGGTHARTTIRYSRFDDPAIRIEAP